MDFIFGGSSGGGGAPGGADTQVQFNDGDEFAGDAGFTFDGNKLEVNKQLASNEAVASFNAQATSYPNSGIKVVRMASAAPFTGSSVGTGLGITQYNSSTIKGGIYISNGGNFTLESNLGGQLFIGSSSTGISMNRLGITSVGATFFPQIRIDATSSKEMGIYTSSFGNETMILTAGRTDMMAVKKESVNVGDTSATGARFIVNTKTASSVGQIVKGSASQTASLQEWQDNSGRTASHIGLDGIKFNVDSAFPNSYVTIQRLRNNSVPFTEGYGGQGIGISHNVGGEPVGGLYINSSGSFIIENNRGSKIRFGFGNLIYLSALGIDRPGSNFQPQIRLDTTGAKEVGWYTPSFGSEKMIGTVSRTDMFTLMKENVNVGSTSLTGARFIVSTKTASSVGQIIKGAAAQTANLQEWQDSAGTAQSYVDASGNFVMPNLPTSDPAVAGALYITSGGTLKVSAG